MPGSVRVGAAWVFAAVFLFLARPTLGLLTLGASVAVVGLLVRAWAAGSIDKREALATSGPYSFTRNPLYVGSFMIGTGLSTAGGHWMWPAAFVAFFLIAYVPTMRQEAARLTEDFGSRFVDYAHEVPAFIPRLSPYAPEHSAADGFSWDRYLRYREWEAAVGVVATVAVLALKARLIG